MRVIVLEQESEPSSEQHITQEDTPKQEHGPNSEQGITQEDTSAISRAELSEADKRYMEMGAAWGAKHAEDDE